VPGRGVLDTLLVDGGAVAERGLAVALGQHPIDDEVEELFLAAHVPDAATRRSLRDRQLTGPGEARGLLLHRRARAAAGEEEFEPRISPRNALRAEARKGGNVIKKLRTQAAHSLIFASRDGEARILFCRIRNSVRKTPWPKDGENLRENTLYEFFNPSTWLTAIAGAAVLLLAYHLATVGSSDRFAHR
jgi:hypothetical protein